MLRSAQGLAALVSICMVLSMLMPRTANGLALSSPLDEGLSSFWCQGADGHIGSLAAVKRTCHFRNVCLVERPALAIAGSPPLSNPHTCCCVDCVRLCFFSSASPVSCFHPLALSLRLLALSICTCILGMQLTHYGAHRCMLSICINLAYSNDSACPVCSCSLDASYHIPCGVHSAGTSPRPNVQ